MSFDPVMSNYVNGSFIIWHLVDIVAKGGQMQIGYGPDANGQFHPLAVEALEYAGRWLQTNGEAIYSSRTFVHGNGTVSWQDSASGQVRYTRSKDNQTVFAIVLAGFGAAPTILGGELPLADLTITPGSAVYLLGYEHESNRTQIPIGWKAKPGGGVILQVPADCAAHPAILDPGMTFVAQIKQLW